MTNFCFRYNDYLVFEDSYMKDDRILKGRKGSFSDSAGTEYIIASPKTIQILRQVYEKQKRQEKLERILKNNE